MRENRAQLCFLRGSCFRLHLDQIRPHDLVSRKYWRPLTRSEDGHLAIHRPRVYMLQTGRVLLRQAPARSATRWRYRCLLLLPKGVADFARASRDQRPLLGQARAPGGGAGRLAAALASAPTLTCRIWKPHSPTASISCYAGRGTSAGAREVRDVRGFHPQPDFPLSCTD